MAKTTGIPGLMIPAFSLAISSIVPPSTFTWSRLIGVITETSGVMIFVESSRPPRPTSITLISAPTLAKWQNAIAVSNSNTETVPMSLSLFTCSTAGQSLVMRSENSFSEIGTPFMRNRSVIL